MFQNGFVEKENTACETGIELVVVVVDLDEHEGLTADDAGDDVDHECECV